MNDILHNYEHVAVQFSEDAFGLVGLPIKDFVPGSLPKICPVCGDPIDYSFSMAGPSNAIQHVVAHTNEAKLSNARIFVRKYRAYIRTGGAILTGIGLGQFLAPIVLFMLTGTNIVNPLAFVLFAIGILMWFSMVGDWFYRRLPAITVRMEDVDIVTIKENEQ